MHWPTFDKPRYYLKQESNSHLNKIIQTSLKFIQKVCINSVLIITVPNCVDKEHCMFRRLWVGLITCNKSKDNVCCLVTAVTKLWCTSYPSTWQPDEPQFKPNSTGLFKLYWSRCYKTVSTLRLRSTTSPPVAVPSVSESRSVLKKRP